MNSNCQVTLTKGQLAARMAILTASGAILGATAVVLIFSEKLFGYKGLKD